MVAAPQLEHHPGTVAEDLRKQVIRLLQANGEEPRGNILVLPQVFLEFLDYDHKMAIFLNKLLYWQSRTRNTGRWVYKTYRDWFNELGFKESVIRRLLHGDPKTKTHRRTLTEIGVEVQVKRAPNGSPTCHYRINLDVFLGAIRRFLAEKQSGAVAPNPADSAEWNSRDSQDGIAGSRDLETVESAGTLDQQTTTQIPSEGNTPLSSGDDTRDDDLQIFFPFENRFGKLKSPLEATLRGELIRLGATKVRAVLERCATRGRSWHYVLRALANEPAAAAALLPEGPAEPRSGFFLNGKEAEGLLPQPVPEAALLPVSKRIQTPWQGFGDSRGTVQDAWSAAFHQLELQLDRDSFDRFLRDAILVDFDPEAPRFLLVVRNSHARDMLQYRLDRLVKRVTGDVYGQPVEVQFVLKEEWEGLRTSNEAVA